MTKRFTFGAVSPNVAMIKDNGQGLDIGEIVALLNQLNDENEQLKADHKRQENQIKLLNKQLTKIPPKIREVWIE